MPPVARGVLQPQERGWSTASQATATATNTRTKSHINQVLSVTDCSETTVDTSTHTAPIATASPRNSHRQASSTVTTHCGRWLVLNGWASRRTVSVCGDGRGTRVTADSADEPVHSAMSATVEPPPHTAATRRDQPRCPSLSR